MLGDGTGACVAGRKIASFHKRRRALHVSRSQGHATGRFHDTATPTETTAVALRCRASHVTPRYAQAEHRRGGGGFRLQYYLICLTSLADTSSALRSRVFHQMPTTHYLRGHRLEERSRRGSFQRCFGVHVCLDSSHPHHNSKSEGFPEDKALI